MRGGQVSVTGLEALVVGATVTVAVAELPAVMDEADRFAERLKSGMLTFILRVVEPLWA